MNFYLSLVLTLSLQLIQPSAFSDTPQFNDDSSFQTESIIPNSTNYIDAVEEGVLYRSNFPTNQQLTDYLQTYHFKTIINLRTNKDLGHARIATQLGAKYVHLPVSRFTPMPNNSNEIRTYINLIQNKENHPILIHCLRGLDRTGMMAAIYRIQFNRWSNNQALDELNDYVKRFDKLIGFEVFPGIIKTVKDYRPIDLE